jgi:hypothetical protein
MCVLCVNNHTIRMKRWQMYGLFFKKHSFFQLKFTGYNMHISTSAIRHVADEVRLSSTVV